MADTLSLGWVFKCAGTFAGVSSFKDDDDVLQNYLKIEFFGGRVSVPIGPRDAEKIARSSVGVGVRLAGDLLFNSGNPKPILKQLSFDGDKNFKPLDMADMLGGMTFEGVAKLGTRAIGDRDDGTQWANVMIQTMGGTQKVNVEPEFFEKLPQLGTLAVVSGQIFSQIRESFADGKVSQSVHNSILIKAAKPF